MIDRCLGKRYVRHSGGYPGFMSEFVYYLGEDVTIILFNNVGNYDDSLFSHTMGLSAVVINKPCNLWEPRREVNVDSAILSQHVGRYTLNKEYQMDVVLKNGRLYAQGKGRNQIPELALYASGQNTFFPRAFNNRVTFVKNEAGKVVNVTLRKNGQDTQWKKVN